MTAIHPDLEMLSFLFGTWAGFGHGTYPTIEDFDYEEEVRFEPGPGKPFLFYIQKTHRLGSSEPLHSEAGYLRAIGPGRVEFVVAQPTGIVEVHTGSVDGTHVHLRAARVETTPTAVDVTDTERHIEVVDGELRYRLSMAAVGQPLLLHLEATLRRKH